MTEPRPPQLSGAATDHLGRLSRFFDSDRPAAKRASRSYRKLLAAIYSRLIPEDSSVLEIGCGDGSLLDLIRARSKTGIDISTRQIERARARLPHAVFHLQAAEQLSIHETFDVIIVSDTLNFAADAQRLLESIQSVSKPATRLIINFPNNLWRPLFSLAESLRIRPPQFPSSWLSRHDVANLLKLSQWEVIKTQPHILCPSRIPVLATLANRFLAPFLPWFCSTVFTIARPRPAPAPRPMSVSVIVPARNEAGNIESAVVRTPEMGAWTELIFVEGNSRDDTWDEIQRVKAAHPGRKIKTLQQSGRGKGNAVREGFAVAEGEILMILDADLTMPPEELTKYYDALQSGRAEFANGCRLVYPMDERAMQFLNMLANHFFGHAFSWLLGQRLKDTLCGTKVLTRANYMKIAANRAYFGEFDPFGDFDLIFGADKLSLQILDIPIRYRERTYGQTNIQRWRHGLLLLRMVMFAAAKLKFI